MDRSHFAARAFLMLTLQLAAADLPGATPAVAAGRTHGAALSNDGVMRTWGGDASGQLGVGRALFSANPTLVADAPSVRSVAAGLKHVLAVKTDGTVLAWGDNPNGELGDGTTTDRSTPITVAGLTGVSAITAGSGHSAALKTDGSVWIWGGVARAPIRVEGIDDVVQIAAGGSAFVLARRRDGSVWAWGANDYGQLGDGTRSSYRALPRLVSGLSNVRSIAAGSYHGLALLEDGTVRAWGGNLNGALGDGTTADRPTPVAVMGLGDVKSIAGGAAKSFAVRNDGSVMVWGSDTWGLGVPGGHRSTPVALTGLQGVVAVSTFVEHSIFLIEGGTLAAFGNNNHGQLGDGTTQRRPTPSPVTSISGVSVVTVGQLFTVAVKADGSVWAWGDNTHGQLGNGAYLFRSTPTAVALAGVERIAAGAGHTIALKADGSMWAWGDNITGQVGDATRINRASPVPVAGFGPASGITALAAGDLHSLAMAGTGTVYSWGDNFAGAIGDREGSNGAVPARVLGLPPAASIAAGSAHSVVRALDGTVWAWGHNNFGQLGDGTQAGLYGGRRTPQRVEGLGDVQKIAAGRSHTLALKTDGTLWAWGGNWEGQLGDGTRTTRLTPVRVAATLENVVAISAGYSHTLALRSDGTVWAWGGNIALGHGGSGGSVVPVQVRGLTEVVGISAGSFSVATRRDGSVFAWGWNEIGQLGDGTLVNRALPAVVLREGGAGSVAGNDWFLDLDATIATSIPADKIPIFLLATRALGTAIEADIRFRSQDVSTSKDVFVFALAPQTVVKGASDIGLGIKAKTAEGKDTPVACVLAQLNAAGQLVAVSAAQMQAFVRGVLNAQGQSVSILNNVPAANISGATFAVGYGSSGTTMLANGTNRSAITMPGSVQCQPQAPKTGWWWNPAEDGRGFSVEVRGNNLFFASFLYDVTGRSTWYVSSGPVSLDGSLYSGDLLGARGGQTLGGAYPGFPTLRTEGNVTLAFSSATQGTMIWPGGTVPIQRFNIVSNGVTLGPAANMPESGWWWNEAEPGRGFFMEWQGTTLDIAGYMYDDAGNPVWYLTVGDMAAGSQAFSGSWWSYGNGQTLTGAWKPNTRLSTTVAPMTITFSAPDTALMTLPNGRTTALKRHRF